MSSVMVTAGDSRERNGRWKRQVWVRRYLKDTARMKEEEEQNKQDHILKMQEQRWETDTQGEIEIQVESEKVNGSHS